MEIATGELENQDINVSSGVNHPANLQPTIVESQSAPLAAINPLSLPPPSNNPSMDRSSPETPPVPPPANDNDSDGESSIDDEDEHPYWANFQQDNSTATEDELAAIKARTTDKSATDGMGSCLYLFVHYVNDV